MHNVSDKFDHYNSGIQGGQTLDALIWLIAFESEYYRHTHCRPGMTLNYLATYMNLRTTSKKFRCGIKSVIYSDVIIIL